MTSDIEVEPKCEGTLRVAYLVWRASDFLQSWILISVFVTEETVFSSSFFAVLCFLLFPTVLWLKFNGSLLFFSLKLKSTRREFIGCMNCSIKLSSRRTD